MYQVKKNTICAIIVTYNIGKDILKSFNSIKKQVDYIVIVDNSSDEPTIKVLNDIEKEDNTYVIYNIENEGIASALNKGVSKAINLGAYWVLTLDHDSICEHNMINNMIKAYDKINTNHNIGILCPRIYDINGGFYLTDTEKKYSYVNTTLQSGSLIKIELFKNLGMFLNNLFIYYVDEEYFNRVINNGFKIVRIKEAILYHKEGAKKIKKFLFLKTHYNYYNCYAIYYIVRNSIFMIKNNKGKYGYICSKRIVGIFLKVLIYDNDRFKKMKYFFKGISDGLSNIGGKINE